MLYEGVLFLCQPIQDVSWGKHWGPTRALECVVKSFPLAGHIPLISKRSLSLLLLSNLVCGAIGVHRTAIVDAEMQKITGEIYMSV